MQNVKTGQQNGANDSSAVLLNKIFGFADYREVAPRAKQILNNLALIYIQSEHVELDTAEYRQEVAYHLTIINDLLDDLKDYELQQLILNL